MRSLWSWLTWVNFEHVHKKRSEDLIESVRTQKGRGNNGIDVVPTAYEPNMVFTDKVQTWYGRETLHCVLTAFIPRQMRTHHAVRT